jgi:hypothetical protein
MINKYHYKLIHIINAVLDGYLYVIIGCIILTSKKFTLSYLQYFDIYLLMNINI